MKMNHGSVKVVLIAVVTLIMVGCDSSSKPNLPAGPGASLACASSGKNAWETYGVNAFVAVNEQIFSNVVTELTNNGTTNLGSSFNTNGVTPSFKGNLAAFLVYAYGGPFKIQYTDGKTYIGPQDMVEKHTGFNITSPQYDYFLTNIIVPALTTSGVPVGDVNSCFAPPLVDAAFKASIVGQ